MSDLPNELLASISEVIYSHSVTLLKVWFDPPGVDNILQLGAGTLIEGPKSYGIVTAYHVAREFTGDCYVGLTTSSSGNDFKIHSSRVTILPVGAPTDGEYGPDLAFIGINSADRHEIAQHKEFYQLANRRDEVLLAPPSLDIGVWVACGSPQEGTRIDSGEGLFAAMAAFQLFCGFGGVDREFQQSDLDYFEMAIDNPGQAGVPSTFQGMSGGGLWQVPIAVAPGGQLSASRFLLSGVIFWRAPLPESRVLLRSHGRRAIYDQLFRLM
jgi:hypothetical protein